MDKIRQLFQKLLASSWQDKLLILLTVMMVIQLSMTNTMYGYIHGKMTAQKAAREHFLHRNWQPPR